MSGRTRPEMCMAFATFLTSIVFLSTTGCSNDDLSGLVPEILSASPDSGNVGTRVEITGANFEPGTVVSFGQWQSAQVTFVSSTTIQAYAPDGIQRDSVYDIRVTNPEGPYAVRSQAYRGVRPLLQSVDGVTKPRGSPGSTVIFEGSSFGDLLGKGTVYFVDGGGRPTASQISLPENWTNEIIIAVVPSTAVTGPVWIETPTGNTDSTIVTISPAVTFSPSLIQWTQTQSLPDSSQGHAAVSLSIESGFGAGNLIYLVGGADGSSNPSPSVFYSIVGATGQPGPWFSENPLPTPRAFHGLAVATPYNSLVDTNVAGYLYVIGGENAGRVAASVYFAAVDKDRTIDPWALESALPVPLRNMGVAIFRSWLYVTGGATIDSLPMREVYRSHINSDGTLDAWEAQPSLPYPLAYAPLVQFGGTLYVLGGDSGAVAPGVNTLTQSRLKNVLSNQIDIRTGALKNASWTFNTNELIKDVAKHSVVVAGGTILVSGGIYQGASSSSTEHQYASINPDGTISSFNGATGSQTIGTPFFNHAAISYVDGTGIAHVLIIGGNDFNNPTRASRLTYYY